MKVIIYFTIIILGTFMVTGNSNQSMWNTVSLISILTLVENIVDHGNNKLITSEYNSSNSKNNFNPNCTKEINIFDSNDIIATL